MTAPARIVIVGGGQAAVQAIDTLRGQGYAGSIVLVAEEPCLPYERPALSKQLSADLDLQRLHLKPEGFYVAREVEVRLGVRACEIDRVSQQLRLENGQSIAYDSLMLATGSRPRRLAIPGSDLEGVHELRTFADALRLVAALHTARRVAIIGGGYIGLEVAATCRARGRDVTVFEAANRVMQRVTCPAISAYFQEQHERNGVRIVCNATVRALVGDPVTGCARGLLCDDVGVYPADVVIVGVGSAAADELARGAGLECADGIVVDEYCRTSDPHIFAAGDCANQLDRRRGTRLRLECVDNAFEQGATAALNMLGHVTIHEQKPLIPNKKQP